MNEKRKNNDLTIAIWSIVVVVVAIGAIILVRLANGNPSASTKPNSLASDSIMSKIRSVSPATFASVGAGTASKLPQTINGADPLVSNGLPEIFFLGAEYCPYCAAERWPMAVALERFGNFSKLGISESSSTDAFPSTKTLSFHGSLFSSTLLAFTPVEEYSNQPSSTGGYLPLDTPNPAQKLLVDKYDAPPYVPASSQGSIPFIYFGGKYVIAGSTYDPGILAGKSHDQIANDLNNPSTPVSQAIIGAANGITAAICGMTNNQPEAVCNTSVIQSLENKIAGK